MEMGYPTKDIDGNEQEFIDGFPSLVRVDGNLQGGPLITGMSALESVGGNLTASGNAYLSLRSVGGRMGAGGPDGGFAHLENLEYVGGAFTTATGDFSTLLSLRYIGGVLSVGYADEVNFSPPVLEEIGGDLTVDQNAFLYEVAVTSMVRVGGNLHFVGNGPGLPDVSDRILAAFDDVEVGGYTLVCGNGGDDPCPQNPACWDDFGDNYCCGEDPCLGHETCPDRDQCPN